MPKGEFDFADPFELNGVGFHTHEETTGAMAECFVEEFLRMGYNAKQVLGLFRNPRYAGPNMAFVKRGEPFVRELIADVFARWGKPIVWPESESSGGKETGSAPPSLHPSNDPKLVPSPAMGPNEGLTDPMGGPMPQLIP